MLKEIWLQMNLLKYFRERWSLMYQKREGNTRKREMIILFSLRPIVKATSGYYICKINIPIFDCIICQIDRFNSFYFIRIVFCLYLLQLFSYHWLQESFTNGDIECSSYTIYNCVNSNPSINTNISLPPNSFLAITLCVYFDF